MLRSVRDMRLVAIGALIVLVTVIAAQYIPDPKNPNVLIPVSPDYTRPKVRLKPTYVEEPPSRFGLLPLLALMFAAPILLGLGNSPSGILGSANGNGGGSVVVREPDCCGG